MKKMSDAIGKGAGDEMESVMEQAEEPKEMRGNGETTAGIDSLWQALSCILT